MSLDKISLLIATFVALVGGVIAVESRYALADEVSRMEYDNSLYHLERRIDDAQDKLNGLLLIPADQRAEWQRREMLRLAKNIERFERQMDKQLDDEVSLW